MHAGVWKLLLVSSITLVRVPAALASGYFLLQQEWLPAWALFMVSVSTDVIDGQLARRWNVVTKFGVAADLYSDIAIYWVFVPSAYWYSQRYSLWWQSRLPLTTLLTVLVLGAILFAHWWLLFKSGRRFVAWYIAKGNFWFGVIPVAAVGLWMASHCGVIAVTTTVLYGVAAMWLDREKIRQKL